MFSVLFLNPLLLASITDGVIERCNEMKNANVLISQSVFKRPDTQELIAQNDLRAYDSQYKSPQG